MSSEAASTSSQSRSAAGKHAISRTPPRSGIEVVDRGRMPAVQAKGGFHGEDPGDIQRIAAWGVTGVGTALPYLDQIQSCFGDYDMSGISAHIGGAAAQASQDMGAYAYTTRNHVAFYESPDLFTAAHEAAHVVQQSLGVQVAGGVGQAGDRYERQADAVAERVVRGQSVGEMFAQGGGDWGPGNTVRGSESAVVQHKKLNKEDFYEGKDLEYCEGYLDGYNGFYGSGFRSLRRAYQTGNADGKLRRNSGDPLSPNEEYMLGYINGLWTGDANMQAIHGGSMVGLRGKFLNEKVFLRELYHVPVEGSRRTPDSFSFKRKTGFYDGLRDGAAKWSTRAFYNFGTEIVSFATRSKLIDEAAILINLANVNYGDAISDVRVHLLEKKVEDLATSDFLESVLAIGLSIAVPIGGFAVGKLVAKLATYGIGEIAKKLAETSVKKLSKVSTWAGQELGDIVKDATVKSVSKTASSAFGKVGDAAANKINTAVSHRDLGGNVTVDSVITGLAQARTDETAKLLKAKDTWTIVDISDYLVKFDTAVASRANYFAEIKKEVDKVKKPRIFEHPMSMGRIGGSGLNSYP
jgi:hypothetical protein